jgi:lysophospholipase L1-like esterase
MRNILSIILISSVIAACSKKSLPIPVSTTPPVTTTPNNNTPGSLTYLALGDSYTIGQSVAASESFPFQLSASLNAASYLTGQPDIIAVTGWTTGDLINAINNRNLKDAQYDIVTLLIGVNNQYRGYSQTQYRTEFVQLLKTAIAHSKAGKNHVFVVSIPDWGVTPYAEGRDRAQIGREIDQFNAINKEETLKADVSYIDITPSSRIAATDPTLIAPDGLHPSGKMYSQWVQQLMPVVKASLK